MKIDKRKVLPLILTVVALSSVYALHVWWTINISVSVTEPLSISPTADQALDLYPGESQDIVYTISNAASVDIPVTLQVNAPTEVDVSTSPNNIVAPAGGSIDVTVTVSLSKSVAPGNYAISVDCQR